MRDGTDPIWFIFGVIIILFFLFKDKNDSKKAIEEGKGDEADHHIMWGEGQGTPVSHNDAYNGKGIAIFIFITTLLFVLFNN